MRNLLAILAVLFTSTAFAESPRLVHLDEVTRDWHRYKTPNFSIISLDGVNAEYLKDNIEPMKTWVYTRWGIKDIPFPKECRIFCVPNKESLAKFQNLEESSTEIFTDINGNLEMVVLWISLDKIPHEAVPPALTVACLAELSSKINFATYRGFSVLNNTIPKIREKLKYLSNHIDSNQHIFSTKQLTTFTVNDYIKLDKEKQLLFDAQSAAMCLMLRKELGQEKFHKFMTSSGEESFKSIYGFKTGEFDSTFKRYMFYLSADLKTDKVPNSYLNITAKD